MLWGACHWYETIHLYVVGGLNQNTTLHIELFTYWTVVEGNILETAGFINYKSGKT